MTKNNIAVLRNMGLTKNRDRALNFRRTQQRWQQFKDIFLRAHKLSIPQCRKSRKGSRRPAWLSKDLLVKLREKKERYGQ